MSANTQFHCACFKTGKAIRQRNVKAILSENKKLISLAFAALIQTIKADPKMVNLIQSKPSANDGEHNKDNNIAKYLEFNKDRILNLAEKNYEDLVEVLTNNAISNAAASPFSNSTLSLPQSSSTFIQASNQRDTHRKEEPET